MKEGIWEGSDSLQHNSHNIFFWLNNQLHLSQTLENKTFNEHKESLQINLHKSLSTMSSTKALENIIKTSPLKPYHGFFFFFVPDYLTNHGYFITLSPFSSLRDFLLPVRLGFLNKIPPKVSPQSPIIEASTDIHLCLSYSNLLRLPQLDIYKLFP